MIHVEFDVAIEDLLRLSAMATVLILTAVLAVLVRRRRKRERELRLMRGIKQDFFPQAENPVIEEIRREVDASHRLSVRRDLLEEWRRDGSILLERRKGA